VLLPLDFILRFFVVYIDSLCLNLKFCMEIEHDMTQAVQISKILKAYSLALDSQSSRYYLININKWDPNRRVIIIHCYASRQSPMARSGTTEIELEIYYENMEVSWLCRRVQWLMSFFFASSTMIDVTRMNVVMENFLSILLPPSKKSFSLPQK